MRSLSAKKLLCLLLALALSAAVLPLSAAAEGVRLAVVPAPQSLEIDGLARSGVEIYNINDETYYRLRDIAMLLRGTQSAFSVDYDDDTRRISVTRGGTYIPVGGELITGEDRSASCVPSNQKLLIDGALVPLRAYNLGDTNFFRLRDLGPVLGFDVDYDAARNTVLISTESSRTLIRLGSSDCFLRLSGDYAPRETGGYVNAVSGLSFDVFELKGVSDLRACAEQDAVKSRSGAAVTDAGVPGYSVLRYSTATGQVCFLDAGEGLCEKLVFRISGGHAGEVSEILGTLTRPVRVLLGGGPLSLYLPDSFACCTAPDGAPGQDGAFSDASAKHSVDVDLCGDIEDFDTFVSALGKQYGGDGSVRTLSLITKYSIIDPVPARLRAHGAACCMASVINLSGGRAVSVMFWADDANFGWALKILRTLSAS